MQHNNVGTSNNMRHIETTINKIIARTEYYENAFCKCPSANQ